MIVGFVFERCHDVYYMVHRSSFDCGIVFLILKTHAKVLT